MKVIIRILLFVFFVNNALAQVNCLIPNDKLDNKKAEVLKDWENAGSDALKNTICILKDGIIIENTGALCGEAINSELDGAYVDEFTYIYFPSGTYLIDEPLVLLDKTILKGAGADPNEEDATKFIFLLPESYEGNHCISITKDSCGVEDLYIENSPFNISIIDTPDNFCNNELNYRAKYITGLEIEVEDKLGKLICSGEGTVTDGEFAEYYCDAELIEGETYCVTAIFHLGTISETIIHSVEVENGKLSFPTGEKSLKNKFFEKDITTIPQDNTKLTNGNTINISGDHNWVRGIHSYKTQKMHVYINGEHNTVSGCYFTKSYDYGGDGNGYGVCLSGSGLNLVENNVFIDLRHSMVLQFNVFRNVLAYNSSIDAHGWHKGDMILHCGDEAGNETGPMLNLMEGNIVERAYVDRKEPFSHYHNGKFNTYFRNRAIYSFRISRVKKQYKKLQCAQNVVGCNMDPNWDPYNGSTLHKLDKYGHKDYYNNGSKWKNLPSDRISYFKQSTPGFFSSGFEWPFKPKRSNVTPARDRQNTYNSNGTSPAVFQGLADYDLNCAEDIEVYSGMVWNNENLEFKAMDEIIIENCQIVTGNTLTFKAATKVLLTSGTHISPGNNVHIFYTNDLCDWGKKEVLKDFNYSDRTTDVNSVSKLAEQIRIFPNPNSGNFKLETNLSVQKENIRIYDMMGREMEFAYINQSINLLSPYPGALFVHISVQGESIVKKIMINEN